MPCHFVAFRSILPGLFNRTPRVIFGAMNSTSEWREIEGFPDYEVAADGRVRSWRRKPCVWRNPHGGRRGEPIVLTGSVTPLRYVAYILRDGAGLVKRRLAHRLVAKAFLPPPSPDQTDVAHCDGNPSNNDLSNLRWATHRENQMDMRRHGTMQDGERCITAKITEADALQIRAEVMAGPRGTQLKLAARYGLSPAQISRIAKGKRWAVTL
jgi:hypothetical protein